MALEQLKHCDSCGQAVRIVVTEGHRDGQANLRDDPTEVCLDFGPGCDEITCPIFGVAGIVMGVRLARSGLKKEPWDTLTARCSGCDQSTQLQVLGGAHAYCPFCGTTNRFLTMKLEEGGWVAVARPD
jgi:rRNA maturation endonuclease Nob1